MQLAESCGLRIRPDEELTREQLMKLKAQYDQVCRPGKNKPGKTDEQKREAAMRTLEQYVRDRCIFVDLSSILEPAGEAALRNIQPLLVKYGKRLFIPQSVMTALKRLAEDPSDPERAMMCRKRYEVIVYLLKNNQAQIRRFDDPDSTPAQDLLKACSHFRMRYALLVLTQDERLAADLLSLNSQRSAIGSSVLVKQINKHGFLSDLTESRRERFKGFRICQTPRKEPDKRLPLQELPKQGEYVYSSPDGRGEIQLQEQIGFGGEGVIYRTNASGVAKLYKPECCTEYRREKVRKMIQAGLSYEGICFPTSELYNRHGEFVGYMMMEAKGVSLQAGIFRKPIFRKKFPDWKKKDMAQLAVTILHKIRYLHGKNIIVGDLNGNNILVVSPLEVYIVDTDSYQIDDLPCPVGMPQFTAPEIHQMHKTGALTDFTQIMRTKESEYFAIATLLFMLMLPGKMPCSHSGGENIVDNIINMDFPYALGERRGQNVPDGTWKYIWSHLTRRLKERFDQVFTKSEGKSEFNIQERLDVEQWILEMTEYRRILEEWERLLEAGKPKTQELEQRIAEEERRSGPELEALRRELKVHLASLPDSMSLEIYPNRLKRQRNMVYVTCRGEGCNREYPEDAEQLKSGFCPECQRKGEEVECLDCGTKFIFSNYDKYHRKFKRPNLCPVCRKSKDEVVKEYKCATPGCFEKVRVTRGRELYLKQANKPLPKYCEECFKIQRQNNRPPFQPSKPAMPKPKSEMHSDPFIESLEEDLKRAGHQGSGHQGCFITTAVCGYLGKPDDCQELTDFRNFRDNWLRSQPGGEEQIREYYECAPELVRRMHASADYEKICMTLWRVFLVPCQQMIQAGSMEQCRAHYTAMVDYLRKAVGA